MKNRVVTIILIILLSLVAISLAGVLVFTLSGKTKFAKGFNYKLSEELIYNEIAEEVNNIYINSSASEINISKSEDNNFKVVVYGDKSDKLNVSNDGGVLKLSYEQKSCVGICLNNKIGKIEVYVPEDFENTINVENDYGDILIDEFKNATLNIDEDAGNVIVKEALNVKVKNDYGNIEIDKADSINVDEDSGTVKIGEVSILIANNDYGDIKVDKINKYVEVKLDCGEVDINNLFITENSSIKNDLGTIKIGNTSEIYIDAKTDLGNIKVNNNFNKSDITLTLRNNCGDININN